MFRLAMSLALGSLLGSAACAATLQPRGGTVLINHGAGFEHVTGPTNAGVGDSVMVSPGGSAQVVYDDQCAVSVKPGQLVTIAQEAPCKMAKTEVPDFEGTRMNAGASKYGAYPYDDDTAAWVVGGAAIGGGVGVGIMVNELLNDKTASP